MPEEENDVKKNHKGHLRILLIILGLFVLCWFISWLPVVERMDIDILPADEDVARIVLITDLHSCWYGPGQKWLLDAVDKEDPDIILLGGDFFDDVLDEKMQRSPRSILRKTITVIMLREITSTGADVQMR